MMDYSVNKSAFLRTDVVRSTSVALGERIALLSSIYTGEPRDRTEGSIVTRKSRSLHGSLDLMILKALRASMSVPLSPR